MRTIHRLNRFRTAMFLVAVAAHSGFAGGAEWLAGFSRIDVTPTQPVRMAGYGSRDHPSEGVDTKLFVRAFALKAKSNQQPWVLISVETIGLPGSITQELAKRISADGIPRENIVFCCTHTHAGPDLISELSNIFTKEMSDEEIAAGKQYKQQLKDGILQAVEDSLAKLAPARLSFAVGQASFAANRRVLKNGRWSGFGVQSDGPVDHTVPVLRITDINDKLRGIVFNYACHCTTLGGDHYNINGDWAGYASSNLESKYPSAIALCTIGCGADANPEPRGTLDATKVHGRSLAVEVQRIVNDQMKPIDALLQARFDYAALSFDLPTQEELERRVKESGNPQAKRHAEQLLATLAEHHRLPATYPVPIQSWQFGDQLSMVFLGGEVVVDYALRLKRTLHDPDLWVTAYANDVLGYIASEKMRAEGGYEFDRSGVFYGLPGPWASGTEDLLIRRVEELLRSRGRSRPVDPRDSSSTFQLTDGYEIELVASEPLIQDPVNIAFDAQGRLWVVEMGDYPEGIGGGKNGGRIKTLTDTNGDGIFDEDVVFLDDLSYPTGVLPWHDGVLVSSAPDILFARDTDGDGKADEVNSLYTGFRIANPQHRVNGFTYGLDHSLHLASGDNLAKLTSTKTGDVVDASGHDVQVWPDSGRIDITSGRTQFVRSRDDWGEWFGNDNSRPMYHFPIDDAYLSRNPHVSYSDNRHQLFDPPVAPPVFPITAATERFNDLFAANRFTSACSAILVRTPSFAISGNRVTALICEPVHNLVHRALLEPQGATYQATRGPQEIDQEFLVSSDPWFRPVRAIVGPDDRLYIVDMYRETIEHPQWIPDAWQAQLDVRAGSDRGRIYRIRPSESKSIPMRRFDQLSIHHLIQQLRSPNGALRDLAQQWIIQRENWTEAIPLLAKLAGDDSNPQSRVHALAILDLQNRLGTGVLTGALESQHAGVLMAAIRIAETRLESEPDLLQQLGKTADHCDARVVLRTALALGQTKHADAGKILTRIACRDLGKWVSRAVSSSASHHAPDIVASLLKETRQQNDIPLDLLTDLLITSQAGGVNIAAEYGDTFAKSDADFLSQLQLAASFTAAIRSSQLQSGESDQVAKLLQPLYARAVDLIQDHEGKEEQRCAAFCLIGIGVKSAENETRWLLDLIHPNTPSSVQAKVIDRLSCFSDTATCDALVQRWTSMTKSVRDQVVSRMLERQAWTMGLLAALESGEIPVNDLSTAARVQLSHTGSRSMRVRAERLTRTSGTVEKQALVNEVLAALDDDRDIPAGEALFKQHCAVCHVANANGQAVGASLENLTDRSDRALVTAILDPNRAVDPKYQSYVIMTKDDRVLVGAIESEAGQSVTLSHADGKRTTIRRADIQQLKNSGVSLMPEGLEEVLKPPRLKHVLAYLQKKQ